MGEMDEMGTDVLTEATGTPKKMGEMDEMGTDALTEAAGTPPPHDE